MRVICGILGETDCVCESRDRKLMYEMIDVTTSPHNLFHDACRHLVLTEYGSPDDSK
jgi:hypothetical protein